MAKRKSKNYLIDKPQSSGMMIPMTKASQTSPRLTIDEAEAVIAELAKHIPPVAVGRMMRHLADDLGLSAATTVGDLISAAAPRTAAGQVRIAMEQARRVEAARSRLAAQGGIP